MTIAALDFLAVVWQHQPFWMRALTVGTALTLLIIGVLAAAALRPYVLYPEEGE